MFNVKKGPGLTLQQTDFRGTNANPTTYAGTAYIQAGNLCYISSTSVVTLCATTCSSAVLRGFAINNNYDGDAIESGKIALFALDGASIIETDMVDTTGDSTGTTGTSGITLANYPIGTPIYPSNSNCSGSGKAGYVCKTAGASVWANPIGWVEGVRYLQNATPYPVGVSSTQNYTTATEYAAYLAETATTGTGQPIYTPTTGSYTFKPQVNIAVLAIKLASA